jgi:hypothetical protein
MMMFRQVHAVPLTYEFETRGAFQFPGVTPVSGTFTIDVESPLGIYDASDFTGTGAGKPWTRVFFHVEEGLTSGLTFDFAGQRSVTFLVNAPIAGPGTEALSEWEIFLRQYHDTSEFRITPVAQMVPDGGPSTLLAGTVLIGMFLVSAQRRRHRDFRRA